MIHRNIELTIVMLAALAPLFLLASEVDGDEFVKGGTGLIGGGVVVAVYRMWQSHGKQK